MFGDRPLRILFLADAGPEVGGGHVMRCLTLARALIAHGAECAFVESRAAAPILRRFGWPAQTLVAMADALDLGGLLAYAARLADLFEADLVVIDHYRISEREAEPLRAGADRRIVVIDDLARDSRFCDLLVDPGYGRRPDAYRGLVPPQAKVLAGPAYALVRPEFASARPRALSRRAKHGPVRRALVSLGLTDLGGVTAKVVAALAPVLDDVRLDIVVGSEAPSLPALEAMARTDRRLHLWIDSPDMASLMADADIAVGAGGSSAWERAVVGLPCVTLVLADNQRPMARKMADAGLTLAVEAPAGEAAGEGLSDAFGQLLADAGLRWRLAERLAELCDGHGAARVAEAMLIAGAIRH